MTVRKIAIEVICMLLIALFLYTALSKIFTFEEFSKQMNRQLLPEMFKPILVWAVPAVEILLAVALMFDRTRFWALIGSAILMAAFTIYVFLVYYRYLGDIVPCSCGGALRGLDWDEHLYFNASFTLLALIGVFLQRLKKTPRRLKISSPAL